MTKEQAIFYIIGKVAAGAAGGLLIGSTLWYMARVITDGMVVLNHKANRIRQGKES